jgi:predicted transcriptional regulator
VAKTGIQRLAGGELESLILNLLWDAGDWLTPRRVGERLPPSHPLAYTSVLTILVRLWNKGLLERQPDGRAFAYRPLRSREESAARQMRAFLEASGDHDTALAHFLSGLNTRDKGRLQSLLQRRKRP